MNRHLVPAGSRMNTTIAIKLLSLFAATFIFLGTNNSRAAFAADTLVTDSTSIDKLTDQILLKGLALERAYLKYKIIASREPKLRALRYFLGQQASLGLFLGGDITGIYETGKNLRTPENISIKILKGGLRTELVGSIIGGASSATEICSNGFVAWRNKKHKDDPASAKLGTKAALYEINNLLAKRACLVSEQKNSPAYEIYESEGQLLENYRDWYIYEFAKIYADVKSYQTSANVYYFLNTAANSIFSAAAYLAIRSFQKPGLISPSIVTSLAGDGPAIISAPASEIAKRLLYRHYFKNTYKTLEETKLREQVYDVESASINILERLHNDVSHASDQALAQAGAIKQRLAAYDLWDQRYDEYIEQEARQLRRYNKIALQSIIFGPLISGTLLAQDLTGVAAYYGNKRHPKTANNLACAGFVTAGCGAAFGLSVTTLYYLDEILNKQKLKSTGNLPEQLVRKRLKTLDEIETMIGTTNSH